MDHAKILQQRGTLLLLWLKSILVEWSLEDFEDFLVSDFLLGLEGGKVWCRSGAELGDTVLGDGCTLISMAGM